MIAGTTGNGGFMTIKPFSSALMLVFVEELPTFLLALGTIFPYFRTDIGFGVSFFLLRICYHLFIMYIIFISKLEMASFVISSISFAMNFYWFVTWMLKYGRRLLLKK